MKLLIGGFDLTLSPAEYRVTEVKTFIFSYNEIVDQKTRAQTL